MNLRVYDFSGALVGSGLAGFFAANGSGQSKRAGMGAGILGAVPAFAWSSDFLREWFLTFASGGGPVFAVALLCLLVFAIGTFAMLIGVFGGPSAAGSLGNSIRRSATESSPFSPCRRAVR